MRFLYLFGLLLVGFIPASAQQPSPNRKGYADFVISGSDVWLLTRSGGLERGNLRSLTATPVPAPSGIGLSAISKDTANALVAVDSSGRIWQLDSKNQQWSNVASSPHKWIHGLAVDSHNQYLIISQAGVWLSATQETYFPADSLFLNRQINQWMRLREKPVYLLDRHDRLWFGYAYGEWGGELFVFDATKKQFLPVSPGNFTLPLNPVASIVESRNNVFVTAGMAHFTTHGTIARFTNLAGNVVFKSEPYWKPISSRKGGIQEEVGGEYIGPAAFDSRTNCLYFYSQNGIFKGNVSKNLSTINQWTRIAQPNLKWTGGQRNAVGPAMNVLKMAFSTTGHLLLLTEHEGLGQFDGKTFRFIKLAE